MKKLHKLDSLEIDLTKLVRQWRITIQCPLAGVETLTEALSRELDLRQGAYDHCVYIRGEGKQQFRALEGSHAGNEGTLQSTQSEEIVFSMLPDTTVLKKMFQVVFEHGVQEEPTIYIDEIWSSQSKYLDDKDNPNRYWNRPDANEIHGQSSQLKNND